MSRSAVRASLEDFARTGRLGPLDLGLTREDVANLLGQPSKVLEGFVPQASDVWMYGDAGVYFEDERVYLIHFEDFGVPAGGGHLALDPWFVRRGLSLEALQRALREVLIEFRTDPDPMSRDICEVVTTSAGVCFIVQTKGEPHELGLCGLSRRTA